MKKLPVFMFTLIAFSSWAQIKDIEVIVGPNLSMVRSNLTNVGSGSKANFNAKMGFSAGLGSNYYFNDRFSLATQLLYQQTAVRGDFPFEYGGGIGTMELTTVFDRISLPVRARYTVGNKVKFSGEVGGFVNYLLNTTAKDYFLYDSNNPNYLMYNAAIQNFAGGSQQYKPFEAGLSFGLSSLVSVSETLSIKLALSDHYGLTNISALSHAYQPTRNSNYMRSTTLNLLAGIVYSFH